MGTGIAFPDAKSALTAAYKKAGSTNTFRGHVAEWLEEINGETIKIEAGQD
jgi:hypothetical protein